MKTILILGVLLFASAAHADTVVAPGGGNYLVIPDGSVVTSNVIGPGPDDPLEYQFATFSFAGGTGKAGGDWENGEEGSLFFSQPVSNVSFTWEGQWFQATDNVGDSLYLQPGLGGTSFDPSGNYPTSGSWSFAGTGITEIDFGADVYTGGIDSISYTIDGPTSMPEPAPLALLAIGLVGLAMLKLRAA